MAIMIGPMLLLMQVISTEYMDYPSTRLLYTAHVHFLHILLKQPYGACLTCLT